jgi:hypothetical protein
MVIPLDTNVDLAAGRPTASTPKLLKWRNTYANIVTENVARFILDDVKKKDKIGVRIGLR